MLIIECSHCGGLFIVTAGQKTKECPYCGTRIYVRKAKRIASTENAIEASKMLRILKKEKRFHQG
jgi:DNA-directed RNA polymerase subunit RPC12/RpoP